MATLTYDPIAKQFTLAYSYTNAKGKVRDVAPKPRGLTALTNQILKAQLRGISQIMANISSESITTLEAVATVIGSESSFTVTVIGFGEETSTWPTAGEAFRELVRLGKESPDRNFRKELRKKRISISLGM